MILENANNMMHFVNDDELLADSDDLEEVHEADSDELISEM